MVGLEGGTRREAVAGEGEGAKRPRSVYATEQDALEDASGELARLRHGTGCGRGPSSTLRSMALLRMAENASRNSEPTRRVSREVSMASKTVAAIVMGMSSGLSSVSDSIPPACGGIGVLYRP
jgi:hypothetical protein